LLKLLVKYLSEVNLKKEVMLNFYSIKYLKAIKKATSVCCLFAVSHAFAALNQSSVKFQPVSTVKKQKSNFNGSVSFQTNEWVEDVGEVIGNKYFGELDLDYDSTNESPGDLNNKFQMKSRINDVGQFQFSITETYLNYKFGKNNEAFLGRKILAWSKLDSNWGFGKLNNRVNFDGFEPGQEGLTGLTVNLKPTSRLKISLFGSMIYAPELNPGTQVDEDKGTISCQNAWCKAPDATADTNDDGVADKDIFYSVNMPDISDIVFRYSAGARVSYEGDIASLNVFGVRKPENNISLAVEISLDSSKNLINADVTPEVFYHNVGGAEFTVDPIKNVQLYASYLHIKPDNQPDQDKTVFQYTGIKQNKKTEEYLGLGARYKNHKFLASFNYVARVSEFDISEDVLVVYPRWNQAVNLTTSVDLTSKLGLSLDFKYDTLTEDRLTMFKANYLINRNMIVSAGANVIGSSGEADSYWSDFVNNDTVYSSFKYIF
jgi:hypothetical protein